MVKYFGVPLDWWGKSIGEHPLDDWINQIEQEGYIFLAMVGGGGTVGALFREADNGKES